MVEYNFHDIFVGVLAYFPNGEDKFVWNDELFNSFFYNKREEYSILGFLSFDTDGVSVSSRQIDEGRDTLRQSRLMIYDLGFKNSYFDKACRISFEKFVKGKLNETELGELEKLSKEFYEEFGR